VFDPRRWHQKLFFLLGVDFLVWLKCATKQKGKLIISSPSTSVALKIANSVDAASL